MLTSSLNTPNRNEGASLQSYAETINVDPSSSSRSRSSLPLTAHRAEGTGLTHTAPPTATMPTLEELLENTPTRTRPTSAAAAAAPVAVRSPITAPMPSPAAAPAGAPANAKAFTTAQDAHGAVSPEAASTASSPPLEEGRSASKAEAVTLTLHAGLATPPPPPPTSPPPSATTAAPAAAPDAAVALHPPTPPRPNAPLSDPDGSKGSADRDTAAARDDDAVRHGGDGGGSPNARRPRHASPPQPPGVLRTSARAASRSAVPHRGHKTGRMTAAQIATLLRGLLGTASAADAHAHGSILQPPTVTSLDLPVGLLVLYCAAEETCAAAETTTTSASPSRSLSPPRVTAASSAYSLLYVLEQLSDLRRRDHRREALQRASEMERARCEQLYEAATRKRVADAALQAARAQAVAEAELGSCTFHPTLSPAAQGVEGKGTRDFMEKCVEWRAEVDRRLKLKYDRIAALEAEQAAAAAALSGVVAPGATVTEESRRLLARPSVQERLKARPCLWEPRHHTAAATLPAPSPAAGDTATAAAGAATAVAPPGAAPSAGAPPLLLGAPVTTAVEEEQKAVLRALRRRGQHDDTADPSGEASALPQDASHRSGPSAVRAFLGRVEEDAERRAQTAAKLQARYHNPESLLFEPGTGKPLFRPNAMPTAHKDGRRVGYDDLSTEEKEDFRAELRRAGLEFVLTHYLRERKAQQQLQRHSTAPSRAASPESDTAVTEAQQARFMASLQEAVARRERRLEQIRAQATAEETFHPQLTKRTVKMALRKTGGTPIYERPAPPPPASSAAAATPAHTSALQLRGESAPQSTSAHRDRPLPEATELFLARSEQWTEARQRRLQRTAEMEEARQQAHCTFSPNRDFADAYGMLGVGGGDSGAGAATPLPTDVAGAADATGARAVSQARVRPQDVLASAADVRVMNELELLRSGAAYRDARFVQAVCARSGLGDTRRALSNLSLQSAPRLTGASSGAWAASSSSASPPHAAASLSHSHLSPIQQSSNRPSASPYPVPRRNTRAPSYSLHDDSGAGAYGAAPVPVSALMASRTQSDTTQTPMRQGSRDAARGGAAAPSPLDNPWAALDAETDAVLKRHGY